MNKRMLRSSKGITFAELLGGLAILSLVSVIIIGCLISGLNSFKRVNEEIALHDGANYVMSEFVNYIFEATKVEENVTPGVTVDSTACTHLIKVTNYEGKETQLGFLNNEAVIINKDDDSNTFNKVNKLSTYNFSCGSLEGSNIGFEDLSKDPEQNTVIINMFIKNDKSKYQKKIQLKSKVSFVKVDQ